MANAAPLIALMASQALPADSEAEVPDWVHLLPASQGAIATDDKRGPYHLTDAQQLIESSFKIADRLPIDVNHSIDKAAPVGGESPAQGWIVEMQAREDGVWGRVEWNKSGRALLLDRAYRGISPVIRHTKDNQVLAILRASLVNDPNLRGLTALNSQEKSDMTLEELLAALASVLGLDDDADADAVVARVKSMAKKPDDEGGEAMQAAVGKIGVALGLKDSAGVDEVLEAAQSAMADKDETITALQSSVRELGDQLGTLTEATSRAKAEAIIDGAITARRVGINKANRDQFISMHMKDPAGTEKLVSGFPVLSESGTTMEPPAADGSVSLNAAERDVAAQLGMTVEEYAEALAEDTKQKEAL